MAFVFWMGLDGVRSMEQLPGNDEAERADVESVGDELDDVTLSSRCCAALNGVV